MKLLNIEFLKEFRSRIKFMPLILNLTFKSPAGLLANQNEIVSHVSITVKLTNCIATDPCSVRFWKISTIFNRFLQSFFLKFCEIIFVNIIIFINRKTST